MHHLTYDPGPHKRRLTMKQRASTFPFTLLAVDTHGGPSGEPETVLLLPHETRPDAEHVAAWADAAGVTVDHVDTITRRLGCERARCATCEYEFLAEVMGASDLYDTPWEDTPPARMFCSRSCYDHFTRAHDGPSDFVYRECDECHRTVCEQNPANGWHWQFREHPDGEACGQVCLKCYEAMVYEHGIPAHRFHGRTIPGMFLNPGDAETHGFTRLGSYFVPAQRERFKADALAAIARHERVLVEWEGVAITGDEGHVSLWSAPALVAATH